MSMSMSMNMNMNHQRLQIVMSRQFHTFGMFSFRVLDKIPSSVVCCLPFSGVAWLGWPPVKACNPLQGTQYFCFAQMIFSTAEQYSYQTFYTKADPLMHPGRWKQMKVDANEWKWLEVGENVQKWMKVDENIRGATCISDAVFVCYICTLIFLTNYIFINLTRR